MDSQIRSYLSLLGPACEHLKTCDKSNYTQYINEVECHHGWHSDGVCSEVSSQVLRNSCFLHCPILRFAIR